MPAMDWTPYIVRDPKVMLGKPTFRGTRITVEFVLDRLSQGASAAELVANYEGLTREHVASALAYAAAVVRNDEMVST